MHQAIYPTKIEDICPYCKSQNVTNQMDECYPTSNQCHVKVNCTDCGRKHFLNYQVTGITLVDDDNTCEYVAPITVLQDVMSEAGDAKTVSVGIVATHEAIYIMPVGYGDGASADGYGCPVLLELCDNKLRLVAWPDVNDETDNPIIDLENARLDRREVEEIGKYQVRIKTPDGKTVEAADFDRSEGAARNWVMQADIPHGHYAVCVDRQHGDKVEWSTKKVE